MLIQPLNALLLTLAAILVLRPLAVRVGLLDHPGGRRMHASPAQLTGGIAISLSVIGLGVDAGGAQVGTLILPLALMLLVGVVDDFVEMRATHSMLLQCLVAYLLAADSGLSVQHLGDLVGLGDLGTAWLAVPFTMICTVGVINAINMVDGNAIGTYANRDHLAGLLEMALPMAIALWVASLGRGVTDARSGGWRARLLRVEGRSLLYGFLALLILVGLIFTQSRTGVALSILLVFLTTLLFSFKLGGSNAYGLVGSLFVVGLSVAVMIGLVPVLERFTTDPMHDARWGIYAATWTAIKVFFPLGSGVGTYAEVFQRFQTADLSGMFVNNAHDDYLEWLMEGGVAAAILVVAFLGLYLVRWFSVYTRGTWRTHNFIQVAAGLGVLAMALHSLVDFNLHIPANQIYLALLAGLFFRVNAEQVSGQDMGRRSRGGSS